MTHVDEQSFTTGIKKIPLTINLSKLVTRLGRYLAGRVVCSSCSKYVFPRAVKSQEAQIMTKSFLLW